MRCLRSTWVLRLVVLCLGVSLLPVLLAPVAQASRPVALPFSDWLRSLVREPVDEAFEQALAQAEARRPRSLHAFLTAFVEAYEAGRGAAAVAVVFTGEALSAEALILYLQRRYQRLVGEGLLPRTEVSSAVAQGKTSERSGSLPVFQRERRSGVVDRVVAPCRSGALGAERARHLCLSEQPLGP
ncbi:hypothetical protein GQ464_016030 [Rhodocaloribacter litoris]|uniref:hypothetical protein n=1 Tax=Rhodocaloribacter litoris TaxID=2558931 RepID=UPI0014227500|nr:hypothetical protein [Rhodocaloribacter litoris]QXD14905.1 hypothetical protein GQ464_016030 [Rhodocaloribacter litoris]